MNKRCKKYLEGKRGIPNRYYYILPLKLQLVKSITAFVKDRYKQPF